MGSRIVLQNSKLQTSQVSSSLILYQSITCIQSWICIFEKKKKSQFSAALFCLWNIDEIADKTFLSQRCLPYFWLFIKIHFQAMLYLSWHIWSCLSIACV